MDLEKVLWDQFFDWYIQDKEIFKTHGEMHILYFYCRSFNIHKESQDWHILSELVWKYLIKHDSRYAVIRMAYFV